MQRTRVYRLLNVSGESPSFRSKPGLRNLLLEVQQSPYKEQFKDYWSTPVPFADRDYGAKPKLGDPIPTRAAATSIVIGHNKHADPDAVARGEDNDYKVLMMYRESKGRLLKDQFILPSAPVHLEDRSVEWNRILHRRGVVTQYSDLHERLAAFRSLFTHFNLLLVPEEGGGIAEVEGPPGPRRWYLITYSFPQAMKQLVDVLELPMETVLSQLIPFRRIVTPDTETFRFDNRTYIVPFDRIFDVQLTLSTVKEKLVWVSPMEAIARFNAGIFNTPTANIITLSELANACPTYADVMAHKQTNLRTEPTVVQPELYHHGQQKVATVLLPGDFHHAATSAEDRAQKYVRRFVYEKDYPFGVRAVFEERPAVEAELQLALEREAPALLAEATDVDRVYADTPYPNRARHAPPLQAAAPHDERARREPDEDWYGVAPRTNPFHLHEEGRTAYPVPQYTLQDGREDKDGFIPVRHNFMAPNAEMSSGASHPDKKGPRGDGPTSA
ncbi:hypothetical protein STCU_01735 [Strigomonas culicis]|nr:hypothetical protein STCU_01735 [Strigomonas culicis]|eukprot:EPY34236.1 hypothetical protein STCU_01735 [Strigomonas culicis]